MLLWGWTWSPKLGFSNSRGGGGVPPVLLALVSYIKKWNPKKTPWRWFGVQFGRPSAPNEPEKLALERPRAWFFVLNLKKMDYATEPLFTMFSCQNTFLNPLHFIIFSAPYPANTIFLFFRCFLCFVCDSCGFSCQTRVSQVPQKPVKNERILSKWYPKGLET